MLGVIREGVPLDNENRLREEPHFESMIFNDVGRRLSMRRAMSSIADPENAIVDPMEQIDENGDVDLSDLYEGLDPVCCWEMFIRMSMLITYTFRYIFELFLTLV